MEDPFQVLGLREGAAADVIRARYRELVRQHHPDLHGGDDEDARARRHARMASITAAFRMVSDPTELERFRRLQRRRERGAASAEPGRDGVHFTAASPTAGGAIEPAPGDPDFDYRSRAPSEFSVKELHQERAMWTARPASRRRPWSFGSTSG